MQNLELGKTQQPTEEHWDQALVAARTAWKRWRETYYWIQADDICPDLQLECMTQYPRWDTKISPWFLWCCYIAKRKLYTILKDPSMKRELLVGDATQFENPVPIERMLSTEETYQKLHPFDQWVVNLRTQFSTNREATAYLRLCGMSEIEIKRTARRIWNAAVQATSTRRYGEWKRASSERLDRLLVKVLVAEKKITRDQMVSIMDGTFEARARNVTETHRTAYQRNSRKCYRERKKIRMRKDCNAYRQV